MGSDERIEKIMVALVTLLLHHTTNESKHGAHELRNIALLDRIQALADKLDDVRCIVAGADRSQTPPCKDEEVKLNELPEFNGLKGANVFLT